LSGSPTDSAWLAKFGGTLVIPNAASLQDRTILLGVIFAEKGVRPYFHLMRSFIDAHGGSSSNELIQVGRNGFAKRYAYKRTRNNGSEEISRQESTILEPIERDKARDHRS
jgi:hypothetical protein